jgi:hypothetical protein
MIVSFSEDLMSKHNMFPKNAKRLNLIVDGETNEVFQRLSQKYSLSISQMVRKISTILDNLDREEIAVVTKSGDKIPSKLILS